MSDKRTYFILTQQLTVVNEKINLMDIKFWVCPSYDKDGKCDGIGFRILDTKMVRDAFKWIFMSGNNIIYGKDSVDLNKDCYIVEGFRDYIALKELGYNVIGLGSVFISDIQKEFISKLKNPIILLDSDSFGLKQTVNLQNQYRVAIMTGETKKDAWETFSAGLPIKIVEVK